MSDATTDVLIRVECLPHAADDDGPVRLLLSTVGGTTLARLSFTPSQARRASYGMDRVLGQFIPADVARRIGDGLRTAAITVWSARN